MWTIEEGRLEELDDLIGLRRAMFEALGTEPAAIDRVVKACQRYFAEGMPSGDFRVWIARSNEGEPIASIGLVVHSVPPSPHNLIGKVGYIMNLVTLPAWRRRGIARALLEHVIGQLRTEGVPVASLHASADGRGLYERLGFEVREGLPEMRRRLDV